MANNLSGSHFQVLPDDCRMYGSCGFGVYLNIEVGDQPVNTQAIFRRGTGALKTDPKTDNVPLNLLFIPDEPPLGRPVPAEKVYREAHNTAQPADKKKQVVVGFDAPDNANPVPVKLWAETVNGDRIVHVELRNVT